MPEKTGRGQEYPRPSVTGALIFLVGLVLILSSAVFAQTQPSVTVSPAGQAESPVLVLVDGKVIEVESAQLQRGQQVMVWIRDLEKIGWGTVEPGEAGKVTLKGSGGVTLTFTKGQDVALVNSLGVKLPIDTYMANGKFMVPLSFVAKALGYAYDCNYRPVASISTVPVVVTTPVKTGNTLQGKILYNSTGVMGVKVRAVDPAYKVIKGADVVTDQTGAYKIENLPDGTYLAYVYTGDNPAFFNRASKPATVKGGELLELEPLVLGRIITPLSPKPGDKNIAPAKGGKVDFAWTPCEGVSSYKLVIKKQGTDTIVAEATTSKPGINVPSGSLPKGASYEAQVTAVDSKGQFLGGTAGAGGTPWTFAIKQ